ncbi:Sodium/hydrogen exchanger 8 [Halocaridina rubra]|uniref:Sodium/hydrogen exchanger n=1 Tax=Halocaridina rubra TaxID=373956 RepID=A0AAN9A7N0_HALRR
MQLRIVAVLIICATASGEDPQPQAVAPAPPINQDSSPDNVLLDDAQKDPQHPITEASKSNSDSDTNDKLVISTPPTTTTSTEAPHLSLHVGNASIENVCNITTEDYAKLTAFYPQHCTADEDTDDEHGEEGGPVDVEQSNDTSSCQSSVDLPAVGAAEQEHLSSLSIFLILCVLALCIILIFFLLKTKLNYLPESVACVIVGAVIGLVLKILYSRHIANWQKEEAFSPTVFFLVILPPIIFESGYNLHKGNFFQNIGSIIVFAVLGTVISALVVGGGIYLLGQADVVYHLSFVESFAFGSLISAVDPVATLAIFHALNVDQVLYMLVFGESILNDAVSIVLTTTVLEMASPAMASMGSGEALVYTVWRFCVMFFASAGIGVLFALCSALTLKYIPVREYTSLELCIIIVFIYAPYTLAEGIHLSGIMAILFNGIVMSHYTHFNMSPVMQITMQHLMRTLALIAECTVFIYLGLAIFSFKHQFHIALVIWSIVLCLLGRAMNIFPLSWLVNKFRDHKISYKMMFIMWFSGLRGAIAYALSLHLEFSDEKRHVIVTTTLIIVLFTIFCLGGSTMPLIKYLKADKRQKHRRQKELDKELTLSKTREWGQAVDSEHLSEFTEEESDTPAGPQVRGFLRLDLLYIRPFLIRRVTHQEVRSHAHDLKKQCYQSINVQPSDSEEEELFSAH